MSAARPKCRVFLTFAGLLAIVILSLGIFQSLASWLCLRFMTGLSIVGIYLAAESWLNASAEPKYRGRILAVYAVTTLIGMALGQTIVGLIELELLFQICAIVLLLSLLPLGLFCDVEPKRPEFSPSGFGDVLALPRFVTIAISSLPRVLCIRIYDPLKKLSAEYRSSVYVNLLARKKLRASRSSLSYSSPDIRLGKKCIRYSFLVSGMPDLSYSHKVIVKIRYL